MKLRPIRIILVVAASLFFSTAWPQDNATNPSWQQEFDLSGCNLSTTGRNRYFVLEPGFRLVLEGRNARLQITVLDETREVGGVVTRVVEEREWKRGELAEVSRNYFALCEQTKDVFYFGEEVDIYERGRVVRHDGAWLAGAGGNRPGLFMPGTPRTGMRYYQEVAPGVAMDRAEIVGLDEICQTPAGTFPGCLKVREEDPLGFGATEYKYHAPDIGLVQDEDLRLTDYGFVRGR
jgi:hypothetical protein